MTENQTPDCFACILQATIKTDQAEWLRAQVEKLQTRREQLLADLRAVDTAHLKLVIERQLALPAQSETAPAKNRNQPSPQIRAENLTDDQVREIRVLFANGELPRVIGKKFGVSRTTVFFVVRQSVRGAL
jgi:hypothetical protein